MTSFSTSRKIFPAAFGPLIAIAVPPVGVQLGDPAAAAAPKKFSAVAVLLDAIFSLGNAISELVSHCCQSKPIAAERMGLGYGAGSDSSSAQLKFRGRSRERDLTSVVPQARRDAGNALYRTSPRGESQNTTHEREKGPGSHQVHRSVSR